MTPRSVYKEACSYGVLLPLETAPPVLAVNSDFDEGRIDSETGYAIPDCDDISGIDRKTGAGNTELSLTAVRKHLDGDYHKNEEVTDDLHEGWFGVLPKHLDKDYWDEATVTIRKIDKIDEDTGRKESGQVRFYVKKGGDYDAITPYDLQSLDATDLVIGGIPKREGEGIYGSSSTIPFNAEFWMEGVRPGKITLEWNLQKEGTDLKFQQTFLVCTQQSKQEWTDQLAYMIRLQTQDDPSGEISIMSIPNAPKESYGGEVDVRESPAQAAGYGANVERASEYYDFYEQTWNQNNSLNWAGLAKVVGAQVISGISDSQWGLLAQPGFIDVGGWLSSFPKDDIEDFQLELFKGGEAIFKDIAWQHHAYLASGICALEFVHENQGGGANPAIQDAVMAGWLLIDEGDYSGDATKIFNGNFEIARHEQNRVIVITYTNMDAIGDGSLVNAISILALNPVQGGDAFRDVVGAGAKLSNTNQRWNWVTAGLPDFGFAGKAGIIKAWENLGIGQQDSYVNEDLRIGARRFSIPWKITTVNIPPLPNADIQVWDHLDQPGKQ